MEVVLLYSMCKDIDVANAARVSFDKWHEVLTQGDKKLIAYLAEHNHFSPFTHPQVSFRVKAPLFVARQLMRHTVGLTINEVSRRYVDTEPEFYYPKKWRGKPVDKKQGSSNIEITNSNDAYATPISNYYVDAIGECHITYKALIKSGVAPEMARMVLPLSTYTTWIWTGSLYAFARVCNLRLKDDTQEETREIAKLVSKHMKELFPVSWGVLVNAQ